MGSKFSCSKQSGPQRLADKKETKRDNDDHNRSSCSVLSFLMLVCMWKNEAKEGQLLQAKEKEEGQLLQAKEKEEGQLLQAKEKEEQQQKQLNKGKEVTLEDWLIASPGLQNINGTTSGGEYHVLKHHYSSKRVFPSFVGKNTNNDSSSKARESFSKDRLLEEDIEVSLSTSQSGKSKKRVSFRLPQEADIFIFHSSSSLGEESDQPIA